MTCYIVSFEVATEQTRQAVVAQLKAFGGYCPINQTCWAITTEKNAPDVRDQITTVLKAGDRVFVVRSGTEAAWRNAYGEENSQWLKKHL